MFDLTPYNTFGLEIKANQGLIVHDLDCLKHFNADHYLILGSGSDVLFIEDFAGTVLINAIKDFAIKDEGDYYTVTLGGGLLLDEVIGKLLDMGIAGLENLSLIPGTVGAAPIQNVGAYGVEIADFISRVLVYNLNTHQASYYSKEQCNFAYRYSIFKTQPHLFIAQIELQLHKDFKPILSYKDLYEDDLNDAKAVRAKVISLRQKKLPDPRFVGNAGSFFKNPIVSEQKVAKLREQDPNLPIFTYLDSYKVAAGYLIDKAGLRGITHGRAGTWEHQALVLVNRGQAKPFEIVALAKYIATEVKHKYDLDLEPEVRLIARQGEVAWHEI